MVRLSTQNLDKKYPTNFEVFGYQQACFIDLVKFIDIMIFLD